MRRHSLVLVAGLLVLFCGLELFQRWNPALAVVPFSPQSFLPAPPAPPRLKPVLDRVATIAGRILDRESGAPLAGALVQGGGGGWAETDASGAYEIQVDPDEVPAVLSAGAPGHRNARTTLMDLHSGEKRSGVDLSLARAARLSGVVLDVRTGAPVPGAVLSLQAEGEPASSRTDEAGRFELDIVGSPGKLSIEAEGYSSEELDAHFPSDRDTSGYEVGLSRSSRIAGRVTDAAGNAVPGAQVQLRSWWKPIRRECKTRTSADGTYLLEPVDGTESFVVEATHEDHTPARIKPVRVEPGAFLRGVDLKMDPPGSIAGVAVDEQDRPVAGARIQIYKLKREGDRYFSPPDDGRGDAPEATSAEDGTFVLRPLENGQYWLAARDSEQRTAGGGAFLFQSSQTPEKVRLRLRPGIYIRGRILDTHGAPVKAVRLSLEPADERISSRSDYHLDLSVLGGLRNRIQEDGRYELGPVSPGEYWVRISSSELGWHKTHHVEAPEEGVDFVVPEGAAIRGMVLRAGDRQPVTEFSVAADDREDAEGLRRESARPFVSKDGSFLLTGLPSGLLALRVWAPGLAPGHVEGLRLKPGQTLEDVVVELPAAASIAGTVLDEQGAPVQGATVQLLLKSVDQGNAGFRRHAAAAQSTATGKFFLGNLAAGPMQLKARHRSYAPATLQLELAPGQAHEGVELRLHKGHTVRGTVLDRADRSPVAGARVTVDVPLEQLDFSSTRWVVTGAGGSFTLGPLPAGEHRIVVRAPASGSTTRTVDVQGAVDDLEIELGEAGTIHGMVLDASCAPVPGASISGRFHDPALLKTSTDEKGRFELRELGPDVYWLDVAVTRGDWEHHLHPRAELAKGGSAEVRLQLADGGRAGLHGLVRRANGASVEGYRLRIQRKGNYQELRLPASGEYRAGSLLPGDYWVEVYDSAGDRIFETSTFVQLAKEDLRQDVEIQPRLPLLHGTVETADGQPLSGATVELCALLGSAESIKKATTDPRGRFEFDGLSSGRHLLSVRKEGYAADSAIVRIRARQETELSFTLLPSPGPR